MKKYRRYRFELELDSLNEKYWTKQMKFFISLDYIIYEKSLETHR